MVGVAAVEVVVVVGVGVMVILTMGMVVAVTMGTAAEEAIDGNCLNGPFSPFSSRWSLRSAPLGPLGRLDAHCAPPTCPLRP